MLPLNMKVTPCRPQKKKLTTKIGKQLTSMESQLIGSMHHVPNMHEYSGSKHTCKRANEALKLILALWN